MHIARLVTSSGETVLARIEGRTAIPVAVQDPGPRGDVLLDLLATGVDIASLSPCGAPFDLADARWCAPLSRPGKLVAVGLNYADHARESNLEVPERPMIFAKFSSSIIAHGDEIRYPAGSSNEVDYESELAVVIGTHTHNIAEADALKAVFGYTVCNDVSARDAQFSDGQFTRAKSFDTFTPLGPVLVTADEIPNPQVLPIKARVNGKTVQDSNTSEMIFSVAHVISYLSRFMSFEPGDVISTGTPAGVGMARKPPLYLLDGDVVEVEVTGVGTLTNHVRVV